MLCRRVICVDLQAEGEWWFGVRFGLEEEIVVDRIVAWFVQIGTGRGAFIEEKVRTSKRGECDDDGEEVDYEQRKEVNERWRFVLGRWPSVEFGLGLESNLFQVAEHLRRKMDAERRRILLVEGFEDELQLLASENSS